MDFQMNLYCLLFTPEFPLNLRIDLFGPSKIVEPYVKNIKIIDESIFWWNLKPNTVRIREITVLDGSKFKIQITNDAEELKYFIENPHKNVLINDLKGNVAGIIKNGKLSLDFCYENDKAKYDAEKKNDEMFKNVFGWIAVCFMLMFYAREFYLNFYLKKSKALSQ